MQKSKQSQEQENPATGKPEGNEIERTGQGAGPEASEQQNTEEEAVEEDGSPVLDESDLEENNLSEEESENVEWDQQGGKKK